MVSHGLLERSGTSSWSPLPLVLAASRFACGGHADRGVAPPSQGGEADAVAQSGSAALLLSTAGCWVEARCLTQSLDGAPSHRPSAPWALTATVAVEHLHPPPHCPRLVLDVSLLHQRSAQSSPPPLSPLLAPNGGDLVRTQWLGVVEVLPTHRLPSLHRITTATTSEDTLLYSAAAMLCLHAPDDVLPSQPLTPTALTRALEPALGVTRVVSEQEGVGATPPVVLQGAGSHLQVWTSAPCALLWVRATSEALLTTLTQTVEHALRPMGRMQRLAPSLPLIQVSWCSSCHLPPLPVGEESIAGPH